MRRAVFLDRDGVINYAPVRGGRPYSPATLAEFEFLPGVAQACRALRAAGFLLVVATNQPDVARGMQARETVEAMHALVRQRLGVDDVCVCYHDDADACACRKPRPGLLLEAAGRWSVDLAASFMVGDRWRDLEAARRAGCTPLLVDYRYAEPLLSEPACRVASLAQAAAWILGATSA